MSTATTPPSPPSPQPLPSQTPPPLSQTLPPLLALQQQQQPRKVPPPCWTHEETLALIECYRDRWIALRRGYLRTADWDAVAASVSARCNNLSLSPSKTSAQCRHKIEKLRQRYRAEKQRCVSFPGKFYSTWIFFKKLEFIDGGSSSPAAGSDVVAAAAAGSGRKGKIRVNTKSVAERSINLIDAAFVDGGSNPSGVSFNRDFDDVADISVKVVGERPSVFIGSKNYVKNEGSHSNHHLHNDHVVRTGLYVNSLGDRSFVPPPAKRPGHFDGKYTSNVDFNDDRIYTGHEYLGSNLADHTAIPLRYRSTNSSYVNGNSSPYAHIDHHDGDDDDDDVDTPTPVHAKAPGNWHPGPPVFRSKHSYNYHGDTFSKLDSHMLNGYPSLNKCVQKGDGGGGTEREMDPVLEMASSIKHFGEGFIKIEKMKMDMAMEIEKMKMEMETKRNEMILDSQKQIVDAFLKVLGENNKKAKVTASPQS